jgi:hypothetical protein
MNATITEKHINFFIHLFKILYLRVGLRKNPALLFFRTKYHYEHLLLRIDHISVGVNICRTKYREVFEKGVRIRSVFYIGNALISFNEDGVFLDALTPLLGLIQSYQPKNTENKRLQIQTEFSQFILPYHHIFVRIFPVCGVSRKVANLKTVQPYHNFRTKKPLVSNWDRSAPRAE